MISTITLRRPWSCGLVVALSPLTRKGVSSNPAAARKNFFLSFIRLIEDFPRVVCKFKDPTYCSGDGLVHLKYPFICWAFWVEPVTITKADLRTISLVPLGTPIARWIRDIRISLWTIDWVELNIEMHGRGQTIKKKDWCLRILANSSIFHWILKVIGFSS